MEKIIDLWQGTSTWNFKILELEDSTNFQQRVEEEGKLLIQMIRSPYAFRLLNVPVEARIHYSNAIKILKKTYFYHNCIPKPAACMMVQLKIFFRHSGSQIKLHASFPRKLLKNVLYQNKRIKQERTWHGYRINEIQHGRKREGILG